MLNRNVMIDGSVYACHEVVSVKHTLNRATALTVRSYKSNPNYGTTAYRDRVYEVELDDTMTFASAEAYISGMAEFAEYVDPELSLLEELAPTLSDEQAASVTVVYPEWTMTGVYETGDRVRYSDGFYKCIQGHTAQADWYPPAASSLWTSIIDASILPIDDVPLWQQPDSTNPYMTGDKVTYDNLVWVSSVDYNVWAPGIYGWDIYVEPHDEGGEVFYDWVQPDSTNPYPYGAIVRHNGSLWVSEIDGNVWEPGVYGWSLYEEGGSEEPVNPDEPVTPDEPVNPDTPDEPVTPDEPDNPDTPDEPVEDEIPDWVQPDSSNPYMTGDRVRYDGHVYESTMDNNVWDPESYPAGWNLIE